MAWTIYTALFWRKRFSTWLARQHRSSKPSPRLEHAIREAGREPVQRDSHYRRVAPSKNGSMPGVRSAEAELACV